ncbi:MAG: HAMP domain-containing histidine kinase [Bacteroidales bacterium]|nr:HAMP domain-containing histidine kinase [Bacteroidales bacterium]
MKSKYLIHLLTLFTASIIGLMVVQFFQARRTTEISDGMFNSSILNAMDNVLQQLSQINPEEFVDDNDRYIFISYRRIDELNGKMVDLLNDNQDFFFDIEKVRLNVALRDSAQIRSDRRLSLSERSLVTQYNTLLTVRNRILNDIEGSSSEMFVGGVRNDNILASSSFNYDKLESLICDELLVCGIDVRPQIGVYNITDGVFLHVSDEADTNALRSTPYKYNFRLSHLPSSAEYSVMLVFPSIYRFLQTTNVVFVIISVLLIVIIVIIFNSSVKIIFNMRKLDEMKTTFINNMTHEIKTPIATISLACEMLNDESVVSDDETRHNFLNVIADENRRMRMLVETILQNAKMTNGSISLNLAPVSLNDLCASSVKSFALTLEKRGGTISEQYDAELPFVNVDSLHVTNLIHNLLDNAIKYSVDAPRIEVGTSRDESWVVLRISDHGIGIAKEDQKHIFEKFYRVSTGDVHDVKGFGIGLNYVSNVVALHHGTVAVESTPNYGTTFIIKFPLS